MSDSSSSHASGRTRWRRLREDASRRYRAGASRARAALIPAATSAVCAVGSYAFAEYVLGHDQPLFASTAALISLGFNRDPRVRKVMEVAIGCTLGILIGDLLQEVLGQGFLQGLVVVFVSIIVARFLDSGAVFTTQMSLQAVLVVLLPIPDGGPFQRSLDAVVGGAFALVITLLWPKDLRRETSSGLKDLYVTMTRVLRDCSAALREFESRTAWMALVECRGTQTPLDNLRKDVRNAREVATYSPAHRHIRGELESTAQVVEKTDLVMRSLRVIVRRVVAVIDKAVLDEEGSRNLADWFDEAADAVENFGRALAEPSVPGRHVSYSGVRSELGAAAARLDPAELGATSPHAEVVVMVLRPMMVDLLEATGADHDEATSYLPDI